VRASPFTCSALPALVQGLYYLATGVWPLVSIDTFLAVTGPKTDLWLVQTVGALIGVIGAILLVAAARRQAGVEATLLALGSALALAAVDVTFVTRGVIDRIYLLDALAEVILVVGWGAALAIDARTRWARARTCL